MLGDLFHVFHGTCTILLRFLGSKLGLGSAIGFGIEFGLQNIFLPF